MCNVTPVIYVEITKLYKREKKKTPQNWRDQLPPIFHQFYTLYVINLNFFFDKLIFFITVLNYLLQLFLPPPANDFDLADENNLRLPSASYENLHDPYVKKYFENKSVFEHLRKERFITESGKTKCSLSDINRYRVYQRRILAAEALKTLRDEVSCYNMLQYFL